MKATNRVFLSLIAFTLLTVACSSTPPRERMATSLAQYQAAAGKPVDSFRFSRMQSWEPLGEEYVVIRVNPREIYLLMVDRPCQDLPWGVSLALSSTGSRVHARLDHVLVQDQRCRIRQIQPVDRDVLRSAQAQESGAT